MDQGCGALAQAVLERQEWLVHHDVQRVATSGPAPEPSAESQIQRSCAERVRDPLDEQTPRASESIQLAIGFGDPLRRPGPSHSVHRDRRSRRNRAGRRTPDVHVTPRRGEPLSDLSRERGDATHGGRILARDEMPALRIRGHERPSRGARRRTTATKSETRERTPRVWVERCHPGAAARATSRDDASGWCCR